MSRWQKRSTRADFIYPGADLHATPTKRVALPNDAHQALDIVRARLIVTAGLFALAFMSVAVRLVDLMVLNGALETGPVYAGSTGQIEPMQRADIVDRQGRTIATMLPTVNMYADATKIIDAEDSAHALLTVFPNLNKTDLQRRLSSNQKFIYLRRHLSPTEQVNANALGIPGVYFENAHKRIYPFGRLFAHVLGTTDPDNNGKAGVELAFDKRLSLHKEPLILSLDAGVQSAVRSILQTSLGRFKAAGAAAVVMDANTAELIALVSLPDYDPKSIGRANAQTKFNRATLGVYEMGSTFKLFTAAMALENEVIAMDSVYDARTPLTVSRFKINDYHAEKRWLTLAEIMINSSNIGAAKIALDAGTLAQQSFMQSLGLLSPVDLELPELGSPIYPAVWREINTVTISYGHGIAVTPVHVSSAVSALVNGGVLVRPTLVKRETIYEDEISRVISEKTSERVRMLMRMVVTVGSGDHAEVPGYYVGGKTGSAELATAGGYSEDQIRTSFVAAFPVNDPKYVVLVLLDEPKGLEETYDFTTAGWNAAPTAGQIIAEIAPMLGVYPSNEEPLDPMINGLMGASARIADMALAPAGTGFGGDRETQ